MLGAGRADNELEEVDIDTEAATQEGNDAIADEEDEGGISTETGEGEDDDKVGAEEEEERGRCGTMVKSCMCPKSMSSSLMYTSHHEWQCGMWL